MVRYAPGHKDESRTRIIEAVGRGFRKQGYGGIGVDGLAREAGVTHGAFYGHFRSKADAFEAAVVAGLRDLRDGIEGLRAEHGTKWIDVFAAFYMGHKRTCELAEACTLPSLSAEVERANPTARLAYANELTLVMQAVADGLPGGTADERRSRAQALLSLLAGGVTLARAVPDEATAGQIAAAVQDATLLIANAGFHSDRRPSSPAGRSENDLIAS